VRQLVLQLARGLVREPGRVRVHEEREDDTTVLELEVAPSDLGRVIGRDGRTAHALRVLVEALARRRGERVELEILD
jgi:predicted RNA-binding protein YlqC (UPF0109 family)